MYMYSSLYSHYVYHYTVTLKDQHYNNVIAKPEDTLDTQFLTHINLSCHVASFPGLISLSVRGKEPGYCVAGNYREAENFSWRVCW